MNEFGFRLQSSCQFGECPWYSAETAPKLFEYQELPTTDFDLIWNVAWCRWPDSCWQQRMGLLRLWWGMSTSASELCRAQKLRTPNCHNLPYFWNPNDQSGGKSRSQLMSMEWSEWTTRGGSWNNTTGKPQLDGLGHILRTERWMWQRLVRTRRCLFPLIYRYYSYIVDQIWSNR